MKQAAFGRPVSLYLRLTPALPLIHVYGRSKCACDRDQRRHPACLEFPIDALKRPRLKYEHQKEDRQQWHSEKEPCEHGSETGSREDLSSIPLCRIPLLHTESMARKTLSSDITARG